MLGSPHTPGTFGSLGVNVSVANPAPTSLAASSAAVAFSVTDSTEFGLVVAALVPAVVVAAGAVVEAAGRLLDDVVGATDVVAATVLAAAAVVAAAPVVAAVPPLSPPHAAKA